MRLITKKRLWEYRQKHPTAATTIDHWIELMEGYDFDTFVALRRVFPSADQVTVASGRIVTIFNIKNHFRLITAIHYNRHAVYILLLPTHAEYDKDNWKKTL